MREQIQKSFLREQLRKYIFKGSISKLNFLRQQF